MNGVLLLNKPKGLSSHQALAAVKRLFGARKVGHTGTLDPLATGLLPLCFGEATKFSQDLLTADKTYEAGLCFGTCTDTGDAEGKITSEFSTDHLTLSAIEAVLPQFMGELSQIPPMYSALKHQGKPLYRYAREGQEIERQARNITIYSLEIISCELPDFPTVCLKVTCSKGTYIRTLAEDIGQSLDCGAHLISLARTAVGGLAIDAAYSISELEKMSSIERQACLLPIDTLLQGLPKITLDEIEAKRFMFGQRLALTQALPFEQDSKIRVYDKEDVLLGVAYYKVQEKLIEPYRLRSIYSPT